MNIRQAMIGGVIVALFSSVAIGVSAESFWGPFLTSLAVTLACVAAAIGLLVLANRSRTRRE